MTVEEPAVALIGPGAIGTTIAAALHEVGRTPLVCGRRAHPLDQLRVDRTLAAQRARDGDLADAGGLGDIGQRDPPGGAAAGGGAGIGIHAAGRIRVSTDAKCGMAFLG